MTRLSAVVLIFLFSTGCETNPRSEELVSVRDSAGILIVESSVATGEAAGWSFSSTPVLTIGRQEGSEEYLLYRVGSAIVHDGGEILASNSGTHELRVYSEEGVFLGAFGGEGEGPGEFSGFSGMQIYRWGADSIAVVDGMAQRVNVFSNQGEFGYSVSHSLVEGYGRPAISGVFSDRRWVARTPQGTGVLQGNVGDRIDMDFGYFAYDLEGRNPTGLALAAGRPRIVNSLGGGAIHFPYVPLTPDPSFSVEGEDLILSKGQDPEIYRIDSGGSVRSIARWNQLRTPVSDIWERFSVGFLEEIDEDRRPAYSRLLAMDGLPVPAEVPAVAEILVDRSGFVWVQEYRLPWESQLLWNILDQEGSWIGSLKTPPDVRVFEIGEDYLLGRHLDELGVERLVLYALDRSS